MGLNNLARAFIMQKKLIALREVSALKKEAYRSHATLIPIFSLDKNVEMHRYLS